MVIGLFRNFSLSIILFYTVSLLTVVAGVFVAVMQLGVHSIWIIFAGTLPVALLLGWMLSKLAIEPLVSHFETMERFSKETLHELNLPISTITTNTQMLKKGCDDPRALRRIGRINAACELLRARYDELDYLIKHQMQLETVESVAVDTVISKRIDTLKELYSGYGFVTDLEPICLKLDRMGFIKVIDNLVDNAVKYSPAGTTITVTLHERELTVRDEGRGIDEVELFRVFDRYYQSDESMQGFGIGLDMVKRYCDRHRIKLRIDSAPQEGTAVILHFGSKADGNKLA